MAQTKTIAWGKHSQRAKARDGEGEIRKEIKQTQSNYIGLSNWLQFQIPGSQHCRTEEACEMHLITIHPGDKRQNHLSVLAHSPLFKGGSTGVNSPTILGCTGLLSRLS